MSRVRTYRVNEVFSSLQGEGGRAGEPSVFVRFSGCNRRCRIEPGPDSPGGFDCDTEFVSGRDRTLDELLADIMGAVAPRPAPGWIVLTGGEPLLQVDAALVDFLHAHGFQLQVETNGTIDAAGLNLDWVTLSPKVAEHAVRMTCWVNEVKYVRGHGQGIPKPAVESDFRWLSPAFGTEGVDARALAWCIRLCQENPAWRLSVQQHKGWRVR